jgi:uncharacterized protein (TIGR00369 family)
MARDSAESLKKWKDAASTYLNVPMHQMLDAELVSLNSQGSSVRFQTTKQHLTPANTLHAGVIYILTELSNVLAAVPHAKAVENMVSIRHEVSLLSTVTGEAQPVIASSKMIKRGKSIAFFESEAKNSKTGEVLARAQTIKAITKINHAKL